MVLNNAANLINTIFAFIGLLGGLFVIYASINGIWLILSKRFDSIYKIMTDRDISWADFGYKIWLYWGQSNDAFWKYKKMLREKDSKIHQLSIKDRKALRRCGWSAWVGIFLIAAAIILNPLFLKLTH